MSPAKFTGKTVQTDPFNGLFSVLSTNNLAYVDISALMPRNCGIRDEIQLFYLFSHPKKRRFQTIYSREEL
jgi:hypothetical protein